jgi:predicted nucleotidyltransferase
MTAEGDPLDLRAAGRVLRGHTEIIAGYLYGSYALGRPRSHSDVDVAILLRERGGQPVRVLPPTYEVDLGNELGSALGHHRVEVVVLNSAAPLLAREVLRGRRFYARAPRTVMRYELHIRQRYLDTAHLRTIQDHYLDAIIRRGFSRSVGQ